MLAQPEQKYYDLDKYDIINVKKWKDGSYHFMEETIIDKTDNSKIKRTIKSIVEAYSPQTARAIRKRLEWNKFGLGLDGSCAIEGDDVWMEFNPEVLKSSNTKKSILSRMNNFESTEKLKLFNDQDKLIETYNELREIVKRDNKEQKLVEKLDCLDIQKDKIKLMTWVCSVCKGSHMTKDCTRKEYYENRNSFSNQNKFSSTSKDTSNVSKPSSYIPPHLRNKKSSNDNGQNDNDKKKELPFEEKKSIRISNIPNGINDDDLKKWLHKFNLPRYKLYMPKDKKTNKFKDFAFLSFSHHNIASRALEKLQNQRIEYNVLLIEWSRY